MTTMYASDIRHLGLSPVINVVVCTYNRADLLASALQTLCEQTLDSSEYEVIVVDNNSTDNTRAVAEEFCRRYPNVRYCFEPQQGLSHARNRGWRVARGEYVAYLDDDCQAPEQWLAVAKEIIEQISPGVFGGPYYAFYNAPKPRWWKDSYRSREHAEKARALTPDEDLSGGNIFFRRTLLETLDGFNVQFGMSGQKIAFGEETVFLRRIHATMPDQLVYYDPRLYVHHLVHAKTMTMWWRVRERFARGRYSYRLFHGDNPLAVGRRRLLREAVGTLRALAMDLVHGALRRNRTRYPYVQNYLYEHAFRHFKKLGMLYEQWRIVGNQLNTTFPEFLHWPGSQHPRPGNHLREE